MSSVPAVVRDSCARNSQTHLSCVSKQAGSILSFSIWDHKSGLQSYLLPSPFLSIHHLLHILIIRNLLTELADFRSGLCWMLFSAEIQGAQTYRSCCSYWSFSWTCMKNFLLSLQITAQFILNYYKIQLSQKIFYPLNYSFFNSCHIFGRTLLTLQISKHLPQIQDHENIYVVKKLKVLTS